MKKASLVVHPVYGKNQIFDPKSPLNRDNCLLFFHELHKEFLKQGYDLQTSDVCSPEEADLCVYNEMPKSFSGVVKEKSAVLLFESELIRPDNWSAKNHEKFKYVFTWNDDYVDNKKYFKFNFVDANEPKFKKFSEKTKLCTLIAGNKAKSHPYELYSKRVEAIRWFEKNHPNDFEFFGMGWDRYTFTAPVVGKVLNRITPLGKMFAQKWPSYRGPVKNKSELLQNYKFSICYENAEKIPGYITEKIFDSMAAGCIPVYWGAPNIANYIPESCFIDKAKFKTYEDLYKHLSDMNEYEYNQMQNAMLDFLKCKEHQIFEAQYNARIIAERLSQS